MVEILTDKLGGATLGTLASSTAQIVEQGHATGLLQSFLMKKVKYRVTFHGPDQGNILLLGMARGDASITDIKGAVERA